MPLVHNETSYRGDAVFDKSEVFYVGPELGIDGAMGGGTKGWMEPEANPSKSRLLNARRGFGVDNQTNKHKADNGTCFIVRRLFW